MTSPWGGARERARAHEEFLLSHRTPSDAEVREEIRASWLRSRGLGVSQDKLAVPFTPPSPDHRLLRAARPVLKELYAQLDGLPAGIVLTDAYARVLHRCGHAGQLDLMDEVSLSLGASCAERYMGTNGICMALTTRGPFVVVGEEHFVHKLHSVACLAAPVRDPLGGAVEGIVDITTPRNVAKPGMAVVLDRAIRRVEGRLLELSTTRERALAAEFLAGRARGNNAPLVGMVPGLAGDLLRTLPLEDQAQLLQVGSEMVADHSAAFREVSLSHGMRAVLRCQPVERDGTEGVAVEMSLQGRHLAPPAAQPAHSLARQELPKLHVAMASAAPAPAGTAATPIPAAKSSPADLLSGARPAARPVSPTAPTAPTPSAAPPAPTPPPAPAIPAPTAGDGFGRGADRWLLMVGEPGVGRLAIAARQRLSLLNEASTRIGTTLDLRRTATELTEVTVPRLADLAVVDLLAAVAAGEEASPGPHTAETALRRTAAAARPGLSLHHPGDAPFRYPSHAAQARCLTDSGTVLEPVLDEGAASCLGPGEHWLMAVPLRTRGLVFGVATFYRSATAPAGPFEEDDLGLAEELAARTAICLDNAHRYTRERATSLTLQRSLLPAELPDLSAVDVGCRYLPADQSTDVGGDWFDVIPLSGSRVALVVGDVVGHGLHAAATMGRLRTAVHTLADLELPPEELLARLDGLVAQAQATTGAKDGADDPASGATCLYAVYDPVSRRLTAARAGHPQPAVVGPGGGARLLDLPVGLPLGMGGLLPYAAADIELPEGSLLALYTDGLVNERSVPSDRDQEAELLRTLERVATPSPESAPSPSPELPPSPEIDPAVDGSLERMCDTVIGTMRGDGPNDDMTLLLARTHALPPERVVQWQLAPAPANVHRARELAGRQLECWGLADMADSVTLVVSELVTNAIRYGGGSAPIGLRLIRDQSLICEVSDLSDSAPRIRRAGATEEGGRGLFLVAQFSRAWGVRYSTVGKTVWAEQPFHEPAAPGIRDEEVLLAMYGEL